MKKKINIFSHGFFFFMVIMISIIFLICVQIFYNNTGNTQSENTGKKVSVFTNYQLFDGDLEHPITNTDDFETKNDVIIKLTVPTNLRYNSSLGFYTSDQTVEVYVKNRLIYDFSRDTSKHSFGECPGNSYNILDTIYGYRGEDIYIHLSSIDMITDSTIPTIYIGDAVNIISKEISNSAATFICVLLLIVLGISAVLLWGLFRRNISQGDLTLCFAGIFCILLAIWITILQPICAYYTHNSITISYMSFLLQLLVPISLIHLLRALSKARSNHIINLILLINYINVILTIILQVTAIADFHTTDTINTILALISLLITFVYSIYVTYTRRSSSDGRNNLICVILLTLGYALFIYKTHTHELYQLYLGTIFIIIYVSIIINIYIKQSIAVISKIDQAEFYENLAYRDSLTGLFNRLAYDKAMASVNVKEASYIVVIFDLNNLKYFNDTFGHTIGDTYITDSASLIKQAFKNLGAVYRIGGDEFCIIMREKSIFQYETATRELDTLVYNYNRVSEILKINIAYGYAAYDAKIDRDIYETRNRADAMMYERKFFMKKNQVPLI